MSQHTPGPWKAKGLEDEAGIMRHVYIEILTHPLGFAGLVLGTLVGLVLGLGAAILFEVLR